MLSPEEEKSRLKQVYINELKRKINQLDATDEDLKIIKSILASHGTFLVGISVAGHFDNDLKEPQQANEPNPVELYLTERDIKFLEFIKIRLDK